MLKRHPEWLGSHSLQITSGRPELPILVKLIDAAKDLSVQVYPDDDFALRTEGDLGIMLYSEFDFVVIKVGE